MKNHCTNLGKEGRLPDYVIACVGGSNAIGASHVADEEVKLVGVEAAGHGLHM